ncbi:3138_t:CDS:2, partial [Dentiscutata erythropus]
KGLKNEAFRNAAITASTIWKRKKLFDLSYVHGLDTSMLWWRSIKSKPHHLSELAQKLFSITPSQ